MNIAILFPGYGSQHVGMGKDLCEEYPIAKDVFKQASDHMGFDFQALCFTEGTSDMCVPSSDMGEFCFQSGTAPINIINQDNHCQPKVISSGFLTSN